MRIVFFLLISMMLSSCSVKIHTDKLELNLPDPPVLKMRDVEWEVLYLNDTTKMCLTPQGYSNLSLNAQDLKVYIIYQNKIVKMYEAYYK